MSNDIITLDLDERKATGKHVKALRRDGLVPANIYQRGEESQSVTAKFTEITKVYNAAGKHHPVELTVGGKKHLAMIKDVDFDPVKGWIRHVGFHAINKNETVTAEVPVRIEGEIPAEKISLMVIHQLDLVEVEAIPANLPNELFVDGSKLAEIGDRVTVADIKMPANVTLITDLDQMIAIVEEPKDQIAAAAAEAEEGADASAVPSDNGTDETKTEDEPESK